MASAKQPKSLTRGLLLVNIRQLLTLRSPSGKRGPRRGPELSELGIIEDGAVLCVGGKIVLAQKVLDVLHEMAEQGTTTVEAKSGYGLTVEAELKSLEAIRDAAARWPGTLVPTLLGAHVVPKEFQDRSQKYVETVCLEMIPQAAKRKLAQFVDVFCDRGAFTSDETEQIFGAATKHGLGVRAHVCQLSECQLSPFLRFNPASFDHLDYVNERDISHLAQ